MNRRFSSVSRASGLLVALIVIAGITVLAQSVQQKPLEVGGVKLTASLYNGAAFAPAFEFAGALGLDIQTSDNAVTLIQGGRILQLELAGGAYEAATRYTKALQINGVRSAGLAAGRGNGQLLLPVRTVTEAIGASFTDSGGRYIVEPVQTKLITVKSDKTTRSDRLVLEVSRDTGFSSRIERSDLVVYLRYTSGETTDYQVDGQFVKTASVRPSGNKLEVRVPLSADSGYNIFALPAEAAPGSAFTVNALHSASRSISSDWGKPINHPNHSPWCSGRRACPTPSCRSRSTARSGRSGSISAGRSESSGSSSTGS